MESADLLGRVHRITTDHADPDGAADAVAHLAKSLLPAGAEVSVVVMRDYEVHCVAATSGVARVLDGWQYRAGQGPCLQAVASAATVYAADLRTETRWPRWVRHGVEVGARSVLSLGLGIDNAVIGALNIYTPQPDPFPDEAINLARRLGAYAAAVLKTIHRHDTQAAHLHHLQAAMVHRAVIEQAKGVIMGERGCTPDEAFAILAKTSQDSNRKVHDIAAVVVHRAANTPRPAVGPATTAGVLRGPAPAPVAASTSPAPPVRITTDVDGFGVAVIGVVGELVMDTADDLLAEIIEVLSAHPVTRVVVDLARVSFLDMAALSAVLKGRAVALRAGVSFQAVRSQHLVRHVLHLTDTCSLLAAASPSG